MDKNLIKKKILELRLAIRTLKEFQGIPLGKLEASQANIWAIEHGLQLAIQIILDIGNHILAYNKINQIENYADTLKKLGKHQIIPEKFMHKIVGMAGFRNILVHDYAEVDLEIVYDLLNHRLSDFEEFVAHIQKYLKNK